MKSLEAIIDEEIGLAVERIMRASRSATLAALEQRFSLASSQTPTRREFPPASVPPTRRKKGAPAPHRSDEEIAALEERLLFAVRSSPGLPMAKLAPHVGATPAELRVPVVRLRAKKRLKLVGQRQFTCYFPVDEKVAA